jgi:moderate conductance mechanosensitive channel
MLSLTRFIAATKFVLMALLLVGLSLAAPSVYAQGRTDPVPTETSGQSEPATPPAIVLPLIKLDTLLPPKPEGEEVEQPLEPSFGTHLLEWLTQQGSGMLSRFTADEEGGWLSWPQLEKWWQLQSTSPRLQERWRLLAEYGVRLLGWALGSAVLLHLLLAPLRRWLRPTDYGLSGWRRLGWGCLQAICALLPIMVFLAVALAVMDEGLAAQSRVRLSLQGTVYALILMRMVFLLGDMILSPRHEQTRLLALSNARAQHLYRWLGWGGALLIIGGWLQETARYWELPTDFMRSLSAMIWLAVVLAALLLIHRNKRPVAQWLRGAPKADAAGLLFNLRHNLADQWHRLAYAYLLIGYGVTLLSPDGANFAALLHGTLITLIIVVLMNLSLYALGRAAARAQAAQARDERLPLHQPVVLGLLRLVVFVGGPYLILLGWNVDFSAWLKTEWGQRLIGASLSISIAVMLAVILYEIVCAALSGMQKRHEINTANGVKPAARVRTLLPLIRHSVAMLLTVVVILIGLSELGVNIAPLLAGAGILGVAVGFGSQALVKDFITGLFILLEDTIHVGDVIKCDAHSGVVEGMTIRTLRLRDIDGALHVLPYSAVTGFINMTRGFAVAKVEVGVAYDTDLRRAFAVLAEIAQNLQSDPELAMAILAPVEIDGVVNLAESAIIIRARLRTFPGQQWKVRFAYLLAIKERFQQEGIVIPYPTVTHRFESDPALMRQVMAEMPKPQPAGGA